ncbi:MAG TPA: radical SAM protein, partial [Candidatus Omnitrophica bacterium]|nr:radical SAM protein [Candidatus Omnitrophota bacterium]
MRKEACLYEKTDNKAVNCFLCNHNCRISESEYGICRVRKNEEGTLYSLSYANPVACNIDPIEKKPLNHFYPGSLSYSIAGAGCNFKCGFCQNWQISQANIDEISEAEIVLPEQVVYKAKENNCLSISYTYTEPTIFFEYAYDIAKLAKEEGLKNVFVSNGYMSLKAIDKISPYL